jgi:hypothetical protein
MSQINVTSLAGIDGGTATNAMSGVVKSWARFDGTGTPAYDDSHATSSLTDNGSGNFAANWSITYANADYASVGGCRRHTLITGRGAATTTASEAIGTPNSSGTEGDDTDNSVASVGDLA